MMYTQLRPLQHVQIIEERISQLEFSHAQLHLTERQLAAAVAGLEPSDGRKEKEAQLAATRFDLQVLEYSLAAAVAELETLAT